MSVAAPRLEGRAVEALARDLRARLPGYMPEWGQEPGPIAGTILEIYARYLHLLGERLNAAPDKNKLAFLDSLGVDVLPAQAARVAVVFGTPPGAADGRAPAGTRVAAADASGNQVVFETEREIGLCAARLVQVASLWPGRDAFADHSADAAGGVPLQLFTSLQPVGHQLYLAHDRILALAGRARVEIDVDLAVGAAEPLVLAWEYWDGEGWRSFRPFGDGAADGHDSTVGLTRSGTVGLVLDCGPATPATVHGELRQWIRVRTGRPIVDGGGLPELDRIAIRSTVTRDGGGTQLCDPDFLPDAAFTGGQRLDLTKAFQPLGPAPAGGSALYLACDDAFSRPDAEVRVCIKLQSTPEQEASAAAVQWTGAVSSGRQAIDDFKAKADAIATLLEALEVGDLKDDGLTLFDGTEFTDWYRDTQLGLLRALGELSVLGPTIGNNFDAIMGSSFLGPAVIPGLLITADELMSLVASVASHLATPTASSDIKAKVAILNGFIAEMKSALMGVIPDLIKFGNVAVKAGNARGDVMDAVRVAAPMLGPVPPSFFADAQARFDTLKQRIAAARAVVHDAAVKTRALSLAIENLNAEDLVATITGSVGAKLAPAKLAWEYWDGTGWRPLALTVTPTPTVSSPGADDFLADGVVKFKAPQSWERSEVSGVAGRWLRIRLASGSYSLLRLVSWFDDKSHRTNFVPVIEPHPPLLKSLALGYHWESAAEPAERCLTLNDSAWIDCTEASAWPGGRFSPFTPVADATPALYLGFDRRPPADVLSLQVALDGPDAEQPGPALRWEAFDGTDWVELDVDDETAGLVRSGIVRIVWPGGFGPRTVAVAHAAGSRVQLLDPTEAARFGLGEELWLADRDGGGELVRVAGVADATLTLERPIERPHPSATIGRPPLARFGTPRHWIRARLRSGGEPPRSRLAALRINATWAAQVQTVEGELLGSGSGEPGQVLFFQRAPVLAGEEIEVRELNGPRAAIELPMLREELRAQGIGEDAIRTVPDPRTGDTTEVWVKWSGRPSLAFSGPQDRHYVVERASGRLIAGGGTHGRPLPPGGDNVRARKYRSGGGRAGNVAAGAVTQVLSGVIGREVSNPEPAAGGADSESPSAVRDRGPLVLRHRRQALTLADYEALAREASPDVAIARAVGTSDAAGYFAPGRVRLTVVPAGDEPRPVPTAGLIRRVREFIGLRMPAAARSPLVVGPDYLPVGVHVTILPAEMVEAGAAADAAGAILGRFLHPVLGGADGTGWGDARPVFRSDIAAALTLAREIDAVQRIELRLDGAPQPDPLVVASRRIVCAGWVDVRLAGGEE
jgi:hypothetical protein